MASTEIGVHHPDGEDSFAPHTDMRLLAESLTPRAIVPVVNAADADALAAEVNPTPQAPLFVYRADIDQLLRYIAPDASAVIGAPRHMYTAAQLFTSLSGGVSVGSASHAVVEVRDGVAIATLTVHITGLASTDGPQNTDIGTLVPALWAHSLVPVPGFFPNGSLTATISSTTGVLALRWASLATSSTKYFTQTYRSRVDS